MINLDNTRALERIAAALERITAAAELAFYYLGLNPLEKNTREQSNEKGNSNDNTETAEEV